MTAIMPQIPRGLPLEQQIYLRDLSNAIDSMLRDKVGRSTPVDRIMLYSPTKKVYSITVDDAGELTVTLVKS